MLVFFGHEARRVLLDVSEVNEETSEDGHVTQVEEGAAPVRGGVGVPDELDEAPQQQLQLDGVRGRPEKIGQLE